MGVGVKRKMGKMEQSCCVCAMMWEVVHEEEGCDGSA